MYGLLAQLFLLASIAVFLFAAWKDFTTWKIPNRVVFTAVLCYIPYAVFSLLDNAASAVNPVFDVAAGALLFVIGFAFWAVRLFGAGDAKLFFPIGLFVGWPMLLTFAVNLIVFAIIAWLAIRWPLPPIARATAIGIRLDEIRSTGKVPYGVVMVAALIAILAVRLMNV